MGTDWDGMKRRQMESIHGLGEEIRRDREEVTTANDDISQLKNLDEYLNHESQSIGKMCDEMRRTMSQNDDQLRVMRSQIIARVKFHKEALAMLTATEKDVDRYLNNEWAQKEPRENRKGDGVRLGYHE